MVVAALAMVVWLCAAIGLGVYAHPAWMIMLWPGSLIPINFLRSFLEREDVRFGQRRGLEPVFRPNVFRNGSFFAGYRDPKTGQWPVDPDDYREQTK